MSIYKEAFENNKKWIKETKANKKNFFEKLSEGQSPDILYIGCSDSRVTAEDMMGAKPGDIFVHRNVANLVPSNDFNSHAVIEYAIKHLSVKHVVVCGHYFCGGVKAAMQSSDLGVLNPWLQNIRDVYRLHKEELDKIKDEDKRYNRLVELNVQEQCLNIMKMSVYQGSKKTPKVHGWVFDIKSGELIDLELDMKKKFKEFKNIFEVEA